MLQLAVNREHIARIDIRVHDEVAQYLLNRKRKEIVALEEIRQAKPCRSPAPAPRCRRSSSNSVPRQQRQRGEVYAGRRTAAAPAATAPALIVDSAFPHRAWEREPLCFASNLLLQNPVPGAVIDLLAIGQLIEDAMQPGNFFAAPELRISWIAARSETIPWEIFRGRLVDASQTRLQQTFLSWQVLEENETHPATEPTISVKLDVHERQIHVTRGLLAYVWEGHDTGGGVIESRECVKWTRELVGTIRLEEFADLETCATS